jgi:predicted nucleic acid-binding protein
LLKAIGDAKNISGHRQINDAYLLALAHIHEGTLATLDRGLLHLAPEKGRIEIPSDSSLT